MEITCPKCQSIYRPPAEVESAGKDLRFRCMLCKNVFLLTAKELKELSKNAKGKKVKEGKKTKEDKKTKEGKKGSGGKKLLFAMLGIILIGVTVALLWFMTPILDEVKVKLGLSYTDENQEMEDLYKRVERLDLTNVRQYSITNEKIGKVSVIEGKVLNNFDSTRAYIVVEASILDAEKNEILSSDLIAGPSAGVFQLQVLSESELDQVLTNKMDIELYNADVPPGESVPFMIVFYNLPGEATDFSVKVLDAQVKNVPEQVSE